MDIGLTEAIVGGVVALAGGYFGRGIDWKLAGSKVRIDEGKAASEGRATEFDKTTALQRDMIADLRKDIDDMFSLLQRAEEQRLECRVDNAGLKAENKAMTAENAALKVQLVELRHELDLLEAQLASKK